MTAAAISPLWEELVANGDGAFLLMFPINFSLSTLHRHTAVADEVKRSDPFVKNLDPR